MYTVYALYNPDHKKIYIGQTRDIKNRIILHKNATFSNSYTSRFSGHWVVIYSEQANDRTQALRREKQLKSFRGREFVKHTFLGSSMVEQLPVKELVVGSSPTRGARHKYINVI
jgi:putative endonuclease